MILRPLPSNGDLFTYQVIGPAYVSTMRVSDVLLGPLPRGVRRRWAFVNGHSLMEYTDKNFGTVTYEDPRLGSLPGKWKFGRRFEPNEPVHRWFRNTLTGETTWRDPRLSIEGFWRRGTNIGVLRLV